MSAIESTLDQRSEHDASTIPERPQRTYSRDDFEFGSLLGIGALAQVVHVRDNYSEIEYALKILDKKQLRRFGKVSQVINEKDMLLRLDHPGIVKLYFTFQDSTWLYLALELCPNGDLSELISRKGSLPTCLVQYYTAELVNILSYLRKVGVAHRDIKPENLLISESGNLKLADFDTAKFVGSSSSSSDSPSSLIERTNTFVGTAQYVSPEMLHDSAVAGFGSDLWALGCVVFQMLSGYPPFRSNSEYNTFQRILATDYEFPSNISETGKSFVASLLALDPQDRLGFGSIEELSRHVFLRSVDIGSPPPLDGVMRLRKKRKTLRKGSSSSDNFGADLNSSDEDELINHSSQLLEEDEFMAMFSPPSPALVRSATTAPFSAAANVPSSSCSEYSDTCEGEIRIGDICRPPATVRSNANQPGLKRSVSSPGIFVSIESVTVPNHSPSGLIPRTMSTANHGVSSSKQAWEKSINLASRYFPNETTVFTLPRTETETSPIPTDMSSPVVHSDIAPLTHYLNRIMASDERILMSGMVLKRRFFGRNRILVVTDLPRLLVLEPKNFRTVCEIGLLSVKGIGCDSATEFSIETEGDTWHGEVRDGTAPAWVALMQSLRHKAAKTASQRPTKSAVLPPILCSDVVGSVSLFARGMSSDLPSSEELHAQAEARAEAALRKLSGTADPDSVMAALREERGSRKTSSCTVM